MATMALRVQSRHMLRAELPRWPFSAMFALYPLWWTLGFGGTIWIPLAACMLVLMTRRGGILVPRGVGIWFVFLALMCISVTGIDSPDRLIGFTYRALQYISITIVFVYVYNARERLTLRYVLGIMTLFWVFAVVGGFASVFFPLFSFQTPLGYVLPKGLQANEVVGEMVVRRLTQHNPDSWFALDPRPSAPFLYTNQWGNVYSLTLPMVLAYLQQLRRGPRFWLVVLAVLLSFVPALLTLNRGMFIGLGVAACYLLVRFAASGHLRSVMLILGVGATALLAGSLLNVDSKLDERVETSSSTDDRAQLYRETIDRTLESPFFGYGAPRPSITEGLPSVGTQGHVWTVMFSYGIPALVIFLLALVWLVLATRRVQDTTGLLLHTVQVVLLVEVFYYGVLPNGLILTFPAAALILRERSAQTSRSVSPVPTRAHSRVRF